MKFALSIIAASMALLGVTRAREPKLPDNYRNWLELAAPQDRRPFLSRLLSSPSVWLDTAARKHKDRDTLIPNEFGFGLSFEADL